MGLLATLSCHLEGLTPLTPVATHRVGFKFTQKTNLLCKKPVCSSNQGMLELMNLQYYNDRQFFFCLFSSAELDHSEVEWDFWFVNFLW